MGEYELYIRGINVPEESITQDGIHPREIFRVQVEILIGISAVCGFLRDSILFIFVSVRNS